MAALIHQVVCTTCAGHDGTATCPVSALGLKKTLGPPMKSEKAISASLFRRGGSSSDFRTLHSYFSAEQTAASALLSFLTRDELGSILFPSTFFIGLA